MNPRYGSAFLTIGVLAAMSAGGCNVTTQASLVRVNSVTPGKVEWVGTDVKDASGSVISATWVSTVTPAIAKLALEPNSAPLIFNEIYYFDPTTYDVENPHSAGNLNSATHKSLISVAMGFPSAGGAGSTDPNPAADFLFQPYRDLTATKPSSATPSANFSEVYVVQLWGKNQLGQKVSADITYSFNYAYRKQ